MISASWLKGGDGEHPLLGADFHGQAGVHIQHHHGVNGVGSPPAGNSERAAADNQGQGGSHRQGRPAALLLRGLKGGGRSLFGGRRRPGCGPADRARRVPQRSAGAVPVLVCPSQSASFHASCSFFRARLYLERTVGSGKPQQGGTRYLRVTRQGVKGHDLPLLVSQGGEHGLQHQPVLMGDSRAVGQAVLPVLLDQGLRPPMLPQAADGQVPGDGQQPGHGLALGPVAAGGVPHLQIGVVEDILRIVGVFSRWTGRIRKQRDGCGRTDRPGRSDPLRRCGRYSPPERRLRPGPAPPRTCRISWDLLLFTQTTRQRRVLLHRSRKKFTGRAPMIAHSRKLSNPGQKKSGTAGAVPGEIREASGPLP